MIWKLRTGATDSKHVPWNRGKLIGQKPPLKPKEVWAIRIRLQLDSRRRDLALFNLALDSKLRACDLVKLRISDAMQGNSMSTRAMILQQKTNQPVRFEITEQTRTALSDWIEVAQLNHRDYLFPSRIDRARLNQTYICPIGADVIQTHAKTRPKECHKNLGSLTFMPD